MPQRHAADVQELPGPRSRPDHGAVDTGPDSMDAGPLCREVHDLQLSAELSVASASAIESRGDAADNSFTVTGCRQLGVGFDFRRAGTASERMTVASRLATRGSSVLRSSRT